jgi:hypothetical protein
MKVSPSPTDSKFGGTKTTACPDGIIKLTLWSDIVGPDLSALKRGGKFFQMTAQLFADIEMTDPRPAMAWNTSLWSLSAAAPWGSASGNPPMAIQEVTVDRSVGTYIWKNTRIYDQDESPVDLFGSNGVGKMTTVVRFASGSGRVNSLWGRFKWDAFTINFPAVPASNTSPAVAALQHHEPASEIIVDINTSTLEWSFRPLKRPN